MCVCVCTGFAEGHKEGQYGHVKDRGMDERLLNGVWESSYTIGMCTVAKVCMLKSRIPLL